MKFCKRLTTEINFDPKYINPCCTGVNIPSLPFSGGSINLDEYIKFISYVISQLQVNDSNVCKGCKDLKEISEPIDNQSILFSQIKINMHRNICNCKCVYCPFWNTKTPQKPYNILPSIKNMHLKGVIANNCIITWGGGESTILREFEDASEWIYNNGYSQYIHTNAIKYSPNISKFLKNKKAWLNLSLDSSSRSTYKMVKGVDKFQNVIENVKKYCDEGNPERIILKYIVCNKNNKIDEIDNFLDFCKSHNIVNVQVSLDGFEISNNTISPKTVLAASYFIKKAKILGLKNEIFLVNDGFANYISELSNTRELADIESLIREEESSNNQNIEL